MNVKLHTDTKTVVDATWSMKEPVKRKILIYTRNIPSTKGGGSYKWKAHAQTTSFTENMQNKKNKLAQRLSQLGPGDWSNRLKEIIRPELKELNTKTKRRKTTYFAILPNINHNSSHPKQWKNSTQHKISNISWWAHESLESNKVDSRI